MKQLKFNDFNAEISKHQEEFEQVFKRVLQSGWFILGSEVSKFEQKLSKYLGSKYTIGVANGLEALQISLMALGIGQGDEVITTPISAVATTLAIIAVGAKPVFVDINSSGLIDANLIESAITKKTKVILPVHLYGNSVDLIKIKKLCKKYKLYLIEDACQAHGSLYCGEKLGTLGDFGCFSFYPTKNLGAFGDGGAIVTNNKRFAKICRQIRDYGQSSRYIHVRYGLNSRLDELHAALLQIKLKYLDEDNKRRKILTKKYIDNLTKIKSVEIINEQFLSDANCHLLVIKTKKRNALQKFLNSKSIPTLIHYPIIIPKQHFLVAEYGMDKLPEAEKFVKEILSLPCYPQMEIEQVDFISQKIKDFFNE